ncbi:MarR family winged helix-turn-helix transcriptional regulator [Microbacterium sp. SORGH_AS_0888]|uniref:MarR family winged helix-turn-helix transcriptional regulator n=1 Tax=Microbacterium sp. SORGH_AS_0888 TaxID=3041791 RepID=UPI00278755A8|nr:MarR family winged helix-turn-helix transcriptional regulator [Microbacterium sp. SORGH_AS_0888]MDQ1129797.1 DNA-binding MarR family transcriptional regulator [Microbacterium sp. SORGH_AS_0888]
MDSSASGPTDAVEQIFAALSQLRRRRRPSGPDDAGAPHHGRGRHGLGPGHGRWAEHPAPPWAPDGERLGGPARLRMLEALAAASAPLSVSEIGEAVGVDQPRASRLVQQGVETGVVRREADPGDARRTRIALTDQGRALVGRFRGARREAVTTALADFTDAERAEFARLLTKFAAAWPR